MSRARRFLFQIPLLTLFAFAQSTFAAAKDFRYPETPLELKEGDRIVVSGLRASVHLSGNSAKAPVLRAHKTLPDRANSTALSHFDALGFTVHRDGHTLMIEVTGPASKGDILMWMRAGAAGDVQPLLTLDIEGAAFPAEVLLHDGALAVDAWTQSVSAGFVDGQIRVTGTSGSLHIQDQKGDVKIENHRGALDIDAGSAHVSIKGSDGEETISNFSGDTVIQGNQGSLELRTYSGPTTVTKMDGGVDFQLGRGTMTITGLEGPLRGEVEQGVLTASLEGDADVSIESQDGNVSLKLPPGSGAGIHLRTEEGTVGAPEAIRPQNGDRKNLVGRLAGNSSKGNVSVHSVKGVVRVK